MCQEYCLSLILTLCALETMTKIFLVLKRKEFMSTSGERSLPPMPVSCHIFYVLGTIVVAAVECVTLGFPTIRHSLCNVLIPIGATHHCTACDNFVHHFTPWCHELNSNPLSLSVLLIPPATLTIVI